MINIVEKIMKSENRRKRGLVGYVYNLFKVIDKIYAVFYSKHLSCGRSVEDTLKMSWGRLQHDIFLSSKTSLGLLLEDVLNNTSCKHVLRTSESLGRPLEDVFRVSWKKKKCLLVYNIGKQDLLSSYKNIIEDTL